MFPNFASLEWNIGKVVYNESKMGMIRKVILRMWIGTILLTQASFAQPPTVEQPDKEVRAYCIFIHHASDTPEIIIKAHFYADRNHPRAKAIIRTAIHFWNTHRFLYICQNKNVKAYLVRFELSEAQGKYDQNTFFIPTEVEGPSCPELNPVQIVPDAIMDNLFAHSNCEILGYAPNNYVYVRESASTSFKVGYHELGHRIGANHHNQFSIMNAEYDAMDNRVSAQTIKDILQSIEIRFDSFHSKNDAMQHGPQVVPCKVVHEGHIPPGFFAGKKIKKWD